MSRALLLRGQPVAARIDAETRRLAERARLAGAPRPRVAALAASCDASVRAYLDGLARKAAALEIAFDVEWRDPGEGETALRGRIEELNADPRVTGIVLHLPLGPGVDARAMQEAIDP